MLDFLFTLGQTLCALGCLYGGWLCIRHAQCFTAAPLSVSENILPAPAKSAGSLRLNIQH